MFANMKTTACIALTLRLALSVLHAEEDPLGAPEMKKFAKGAERIFRSPYLGFTVSIFLNSETLGTPA